MTFFGLADTSPLWNDLEVVIRPEAEDGLILYNGNSNEGSGDFLALFLSRGFVEFAFDNGDAYTIVRYVRKRRYRVNSINLNICKTIYS